MTDEQIKYMVDRFLMWRLPENWKPDGGITFEKFGNKGTPHQYERFPVGTNILDADQATEMVRHMLEGLPPISDAQRRVREALKNAGYLEDREPRTAAGSLD